MDMTFIDVSTTDPAFNLALEQYVFDRMPRDRGYFMLWRNDNAIIVGRHQNTLAEINEDFVRDRGVRVVRRLSGGGAVYHDLGNLNFTYIVDARPRVPGVDLRLFCQPVAEALRSLGVDARVNGRNDITIDGRKFSGNASMSGRAGHAPRHHHVRFRPDRAGAGPAGQPGEKIETKGVRSVRSRVTNVRPYLPPEVTMDLFKARILESVSRGRPMERCGLTAEDAAQVEDLRRRRYDTWEWNYGASPACSALRRRRVEGCGTVEAYLRTDRGRLTDVQFRGDFFSAVEPEVLAAALLACGQRRRSFAPLWRGWTPASISRGWIRRRSWTFCAMGDKTAIEERPRSGGPGALLSRRFTGTSS